MPRKDAAGLFSGLCFVRLNLFKKTHADDFPVWTRKPLNLRPAGCGLRSLQIYPQHFHETEWP